MKDVTISAKAPKVNKENPPEASVTVKWGDTAQETIQLYESDPVNSNALANAIVGVQSGIRRYLEAGKSQEEIAAAFRDWKLGVAITRVVDPTKAIMHKWPTMTSQKRAEFLKKLKQVEK